jgi:hypothetical protein
MQDVMSGPVLPAILIVILLGVAALGTTRRQRTGS